MTEMNISPIYSLNRIQGIEELSPIEGLSQAGGIKKSTGLSGINTDDKESVKGTMFESILNSAIDNLKTTNSYLSDAENEEIKFALGEVDNTHDLTIALQKASTALQYTVAVRDRLMDAYKEIMQMQIQGVCKT